MDKPEIWPSESQNTECLLYLRSEKLDCMGLVVVDYYVTILEVSDKFNLLNIFCKQIWLTIDLGSSVQIHYQQGKNIIK